MENDLSTSIACAMQLTPENLKTRWTIQLGTGVADKLDDMAYEGPAHDAFYTKLQRLISENIKLIPPEDSFLPPGETVELGWIAVYVCPSPLTFKSNK